MDSFSRRDITNSWRSRDCGKTMNNVAENRFTELDDLSASITELQLKNEEMEACNRHQNELLRATLEAMPSIIMYLDKELKIIWANPAAARSASMTPEGLVGQACYTAMGWKEVCEYCPARAALRLNSSQAQDITRGERTFEVSAEPVRNNGHSGVITVHRDVSHRVRNTDMVRQLFLRAQTLCNASSEGVVVHRGGEVLIVNRAFEDMVGYSEVELQSDRNLLVEERLMYKIIAPEYREMVREKMSRKDFEPYKVEYITKSGDRIAMNVRPGEIEYNGEGLCRVALVTPWRERHA